MPLITVSYDNHGPCSSFPVCYGAEFGIIPMGVEDGVPMEHLISCVPGVEIIISKKGVKVIHFQENKDPPGAGTFKKQFLLVFFCVCVYTFGGGGAFFILC